MNAHTADLALAAQERADDGRPAEPGDADLIARLDAACRDADERHLTRAMERAEADYAAWYRRTFGDPEDEGGDL